MRRALFVLLLAAATPAAAAMDECENLTTNVEMSDCAWKQYQAADAELNRVWDRVLAEIQSTDEGIMSADKVREWRKVLSEAQRDWASFKDKDCNGAVAFEWFGGSGAGMAIASCLYDHTVARTKELTDRYLNN